uniref:Uncharacterized protein n=1 Tax=Aegilops tauschii subsp. strangulata TaxID=200361 RepID=A0A452Y7R4_AEGTS
HPRHTRICTATFSGAWAVTVSLPLNFEISTDSQIAIVLRLAVSTITSNYTMLSRESTDTHHETGPEGALFGWCRKDRYRCSCTGSGL